MKIDDLSQLKTAYKLGTRTSIQTLHLKYHVSKHLSLPIISLSQAFPPRLQHPLLNLCNRRSEFGLWKTMLPSPSLANTTADPPDWVARNLASFVAPTKPFQSRSLAAYSPGSSRNIRFNIRKLSFLTRMIFVTTWDALGRLYSELSSTSTVLEPLGRLFTFILVATLKRGQWRLPLETILNMELAIQ